MLKECRDSLIPQYIEKGPYVTTDGLFTIDHLEGQSPKGLDAINPVTGERVFITCERDVAAEERLLKELGKNALLPFLRDEEGLAIYGVPIGARLVAKVLETEAYTPDFMNRIKRAAQSFLDAVAYLDCESFGLSIDNLAIAPNNAPSDEPAMIMAIPPLRAADIEEI